jgi:hypothetical protein
MSIKQTINTLLFGTVTLGIASLVMNQAPVFADCGGVKTAIVSCDQTGPCADGSNPNDKNKCADGTDAKTDPKESGVWGVLMAAINIMTAGVGIMAVGAIAYGGVLYSTSGGSAEQTKKAITIITNTVIGLVCFLLMWAILNFLLPGGAFTI